MCDFETNKTPRKSAENPIRSIWKSSENSTDTMNRKNVSNINEMRGLIDRIF